MSMSTGAKIAIGCGIVAVLGVGAAVVTLGLGAWWLKGKADEMTGGLDNLARKAEQMQEWEEKAAAHAFTRPADGVVAEDRFSRFMDVRRRVYAVYAQHEAEIERLAERTKDESDPSVKDALEGVGALARLTTDVRLAQLQALAEVGMSPDEYAFIQAAIYQSAWASEVEEQTGQLPADGLREQADTLPAEAREALEQLRESGAEGSGASSEAMAELGDQMAQAMGSAATAAEVPPANVALFRRHEEEIRKYAMGGLSFLGL